MTTSSVATWQDAAEFRQAVEAWAGRINVDVQRIQFRAMRRKWASMSTTGNPTLNTELLELPRDLGEYVIVHELVHLLAPNHGCVFKAFLRIYLPDWQERERALQTFAK
jgi:predicted metal-dependent hydrolase